MAGTDDVVETIAHDERIDAAVLPLARVISSLGTVRPVAELLHGVPLGRALHPLLVPTPIAAWTAATVLEAMRRPDAARMVGRVGLVAVIPVASPAAMDWSKLPRGDQRIGMTHALAVIGAVGAAAVAGTVGGRGPAIALRLAGLGSLSVAAALGVALAARRQARGETPRVLADRPFTGDPRPGG